MKVQDFEKVLIDRFFVEDKGLSSLVLDVECGEDNYRGWVRPQDEANAENSNWHKYRIETVFLYQELPTNGRPWAVQFNSDRVTFSLNLEELDEEKLKEELEWDIDPDSRSQARRFVDDYMVYEDYPHKPPHFIREALVIFHDNSYFVRSEEGVHKVGKVPED